MKPIPNFEPAPIAPLTEQELQNISINQHYESYLILRRSMGAVTLERVAEITRVVVALENILINEFGLDLNKLVYMRSQMGIPLTKLLEADYYNKKYKLDP